MADKFYQYKYVKKKIYLTFPRRNLTKIRSTCSMGEEINVWWSIK